MVFFSVLCILFGVAPELLYRFLPYPVDYQAYTPGKVVFYLQLLLFSGLAFFLLLPLMKRTLTISLDTDWIWRVALRGIVNELLLLAGRLGEIAATLTSAILGRLATRARSLFGSAAGDKEGMPGVFARAWPIGTTALWIAVLLTAYVFFYYLD